jgi:adenosylcobinamide-phosphate synthase
VDAFFNDTGYQSLLVLWLAIAVDAVWLWPHKSHPLTLMRYLILRMGQRVVPSAQYAPMQHYISGSLAAAVLLLPLIACLALLVHMAEYPIFFEAIIVIAMLDFRYQRQQFTRITANIGRGKKVLTREILSTIVARDCNILTDVGAAKAAIEALWLKFLYLYCGVIFYFIVAGPIGALTYRLLLLTAWQWHPQLPGFSLFTKPIRAIVNILILPPAFLGACSTLIITNPIAGIKAIKQSAARDKTSLLLALFGGIHGFQLGGPAIYSGKKVRHARVGGEREVRHSDMLRSKRTIYSAMMVVAAFASLCLFAIAVSTQSFGDFL